MGATDIAKDAIRIASTAGLSKDVIDLLEKKISLLTDEIIKLTSENRILLSKVSNLETENTQLKKQIQNSKQSDHDLSFHEVEQKIIFYLKNNPKSSIQQISVATKVNIPKIREYLEQSRVFGGVLSELDSPDGDLLWSITDTP